MPLLFLFPVSLVFATAYILEKAENELADLSACLFVVSLLTSLVMAPWQIKLLLVILVLLGSHRWLKSNPVNPLESTSANPTDRPQALTQPRDRLTSNPNPSEPSDQLLYRGISYKASSTPGVAPEPEVTGKYRGFPWRSKEIQASSGLQSTSELRYRGLEVK